ncbi:DUF916 domain-containing protein [candidate division KSB1 bacterium]|nr:DUF916 domain-containing protein [candidate division KSB1 bacterium]
MGPPIIELSTTPASTQTFYLSIINQSEYDVGCTLLTKSMDVTPGGMPFPVDEAERSAAPWIKIHHDTEFALKANETRRIRCSFQPPLKSEPGGYYGMILCRTSNAQRVREDKSKLKTRLQLKFQFACVVMAVVKGARIQAKIEPEGPTIFSGNRSGTKSERNWYVEVPLRNDGNIHVILTGDVQLFSESGQLVKNIGLVAGKGYLLPKQRRVFRAEGKNPLPDGVFIAHVRVGQPRINKYATERIPFYVLNGQVYPGSPDSEKSADLNETSQGFVLDKSDLKLEIVPGGRRVQVIQLTNITNHPINVNATIMPWDQNENGDIIFPEKSKHEQHLSKYISLTPSSFSIPPNQKQKIKLNFSVPRDIKGEFFDAIVFNRAETAITQHASLLLTQSVLVATKAKGTDSAINDVTDIAINPVKDKGLKIQVRIRNSGNVTTYPEGRISFFDSKNTKINETIKFGEDAYILPMNTYTFEIEWAYVLPFGNYRAELLYTYSKDKPDIKKLVNFVIN